MSTTRKRPWRRRIKKLRRRLRNWLVGILGPSIIRLWCSTIRYRWTGAILPPSSRNRDPCLYVFWHQRFLGFVYSHRFQHVYVMISEHGDGDMLSRVMSRLGFKPVRGSSTRGGIKGMKEFMRQIKSGHDFALTPDGPRGPRHVFQSGAVYFASRSGLPILPVSISYARSWQLPTWDGFILPRPWTRAVVLAGEKIHLPSRLSDEEIESWRRTLEERLKELTRITDESFEELYGQAISTAELCRRDQA